MLTDAAAPRPPSPLQLELATFVPFRSTGKLPGESVAFSIAKDWAAQVGLEMYSRGADSIVQARGLSPVVHLHCAMEATHSRHPLAQPPAVPEGAAIAIAGVVALGSNIDELRLRRIALVRAWIRELQSDQIRLAELCPPDQRRFAEKPTLVLLRLLDVVGSPARASLANLHRGLPDVGVPVASGLFPPLREQSSPH